MDLLRRRPQDRWQKQNGLFSALMALLYKGTYTFRCQSIWLETDFEVSRYNGLGELVTLTSGGTMALDYLSRTEW